MEPRELIDRYCAVWNEPDPARRAALLAEVWAPGAIYTDPTVHLAGSVELAAHIGTVQARLPGSRIERVGAADAHHGVFQFAFKRVGADGATLREGVDFGELAHDGARIARIVGFFRP